MEATGHQLYRTSTIKGRRVMSPRGEHLGEVEELVIDPEGGCVTYAVMSFGGFLGMGQKLFAVPWEALHVDEAHRDFVVNVTEEQLKDAPGFDRDSWPGRADDTIFAREVHEYYGYPYDERSHAQRESGYQEPQRGSGESQGGYGERGGDYEQTGSATPTGSDYGQHGRDYPRR